MKEQDLLEKGYRKYEGADIDVFFNVDICQHSAKCVEGLPSVFDTHRKPWICLKDADIKKVVETIDRCPSKALHYILK